MSKSLPPVSAKLIADVEGLVREMKRAETATRKSTSGMDREISRFTTSLKKKFSASDIGKSVLQGIGLGSGFAIIQSGVTAITSQWEKAAQSAAMVEASTKRQLDYTLSAIKAKQTDAQRELYVAREIAKTSEQLRRWQGSSQSFSIMEPGKWAENFRQFLNDTDKSELATEKINELTEALGALGVEMEQLKKKRLDALDAQKLGFTAMLGSQVTRRGDLDAMLDETINGPRGSEQRTKLINQLYKERALYLDQIASLPLDSSGGDARAIAEKNLADTTTKLIPLMKEQVALGFEIGRSLADGFGDAILEAKTLKEAVNGILKDIASMAMRSMITAPIGNWLGGMFANFGGARAGGGDVSSGSTYLVGEKGPELFTPKGSGTIIPNHKLGSAGKGDTFNATYNIGAGVTAQQLMPILAMHKRDVISTLADAKRRRTGAMAGA